MPRPYRRVPSEEYTGGPASPGAGGGLGAAAGQQGLAGGAAGSSSSSSSAAGTSGGGGNSSGRTTSERIMDKVYALVWMGTAIAVAKFTHLPHVILTDERVNRPILNFAFVLMGINTILTMYLAVYLPKIKGLKDSSAWDAYCPRVVPTMAILGVVCAFLLTRALYPVFGFLTPLILGVEFLGALFSLHFIPWL